MSLLARSLSRLLSAFIILCVRAYKVTLSPLFTGCCRFEPSCSTYCIEAVQIHGPLRGSWLALRRLLRCHPFGPHGYDPVPARPARRPAAPLKVPRPQAAGNLPSNQSFAN